MANKEPLTRLWVANLQEDLGKEQIIHLFEKYGPVHNIVRKGNFASIEFENGCDALRAKRGLDQIDYHGRRLNIDWYRGDKCPPKLDGKNWWGGRPGHPRFKHRCIVLGMPTTFSHHDVLNLAWQAGHSVVFIDIATSHRCGFIYGIIEYAHFDDFKYAMDYLDGKKIVLNNMNVPPPAPNSNDNNSANVLSYTLRFITADKLRDVEEYVSNKQREAAKQSGFLPQHQRPMQPPGPPIHSQPQHPQQPMHPPPPNYYNNPPPPQLTNNMNNNMPQHPQQQRGPMAPNYYNKPPPPQTNNPYVQ